MRTSCASFPFDDGASLLGEVALVDGSSRVGRLGVVFFDTLFDENATSHVALGSAYLSAIEGGAELSEEERAEVGANHSVVHGDVMLGGPEVEVDGLAADGDPRHPRRPLGARVGRPVAEALHARSRAPSSSKPHRR